MNKYYGVLSWLIGQVLAAFFCYQLGREHSESVGWVVWGVMTLLLDIRFKMKGYYE